MPFSRRPKKREPLDEATLYEFAVATLGRRMRTVAELKKLMQSRVEPGHSGEAKIDAVLARLKEQHYLDDAAFASYFTRLRQENEKFGKRRVQQDLIAKGVNKELVSTTLETAYENTNEEELARRHLERKGIRKPTNEKETARILRRLLRAGFSTSVIYKVLRNWEVSEETLSVLDSIDEDSHPGEE
jgi:regulatory protein